MSTFTLMTFTKQVLAAGGVQRRKQLGLAVGMMRRTLSSSVVLRREVAGGWVQSDGEHCCVLQIVANFGEAPFTADVDAVRGETMQRLERGIMQIQLPCRGKVGLAAGQRDNRRPFK